MFESISYASAAYLLTALVLLLYGASLLRRLGRAERNARAMTERSADSPDSSGDRRHRSTRGRSSVPHTEWTSEEVPHA